MKIPARGFTLVELLVVIAIMAIVGVFTMANYKSFGEDQNLKSAVLDIQSLLKQAQTNATTNAICDIKYGATWQVGFSADAKTINLTCLELTTSFTKKTITLDKLNPNIKISAVAGTNASDTGCPALPFTVSFILLSGRINLGDVKCSSLTITLTNTKTTKPLIVEQGGRIYGK